MLLTLRHIWRREGEGPSLLLHIILCSSYMYIEHVHRTCIVYVHNIVWTQSRSVLATVMKDDLHLL